MSCDIKDILRQHYNDIIMDISISVILVSLSWGYCRVLVLLVAGDDLVLGTVNKLTGRILIQCRTLAHNHTGLGVINTVTGAQTARTHGRVTEIIPDVGVRQSASSMEEAAAALLEEIAYPSCCLILLIDGETAAFITFRRVAEAWRERHGTAMFEAFSVEQDTNVTRRLSHLVPLVRQVRQLSSYTTVVVVSHDPLFLAAFAEQSLRGRLLGWATKLVVVTRLALPLLKTLMPTYWTFSMMNAVFLRIDETSSRLDEMLSHLPYSVNGPQTVRVASWTPSNGLVVDEGFSLFQEKFSDFYGSRVNVTARPYTPFWKEQEGPENTTLYSGTDYYALTAIANTLNFTFRRLPTSSWAEVTSLVEERVSFLASVIYILMPDRLDRYDFSFAHEIMSTGFSMAPPILQPQWQALYYPLSGWVWAGMLIALLITPIAFVLIFTRMTGDKDENLLLGTVFHQMVGMLLGQSLSHHLFKTSSTRILVAAWLVFAIILGSAYSGNLTATLTLPKYPPRPETLKQLVDTADRITMQPYGQEFRSVFAKSDLPVFQKLAHLMDFVPSMYEGQRQAISRKQAHLENRRSQQHSIAEWFTLPDGSELLYVGKEDIVPGGSGWPLPHDAPYRDAIDSHLMGVIEAGLYEKWAADLLFNVQVESRKKKQDQRQANVVKVSSGPQGLSMCHLQGAFIVLLLGRQISDEDGHTHPPPPTCLNWFPMRIKTQVAWLMVSVLGQAFTGKERSNAQLGKPDWCSKHAFWIELLPAITLLMLLPFIRENVPGRCTANELLRPPPAATPLPNSCHHASRCL
ncbi:uncharacterized protein LOC123504886 [Portunus trituberculatus]|uniref:uncharacterized protein LOC123504886 n=1 Tax=Portunus trituberculatus TaxID=210409 RepID=UPI001E1CC3FD|nr:uncharacterized protein LOC123504886 [Portunus trituberculatus]